MAEKSSYEELEQRIKELEEESVKLKQTEEALKDSEKRFRTIFDYAGDGMAIHDLEGHFFEVNQQFCDQLGYSRDELLQMTPQDIDAPEQAVRVPGHISKVMEQGYEVFETEHVRRDGSLIPVEINARLLDISGKPAIFASARDLTERKRAEEEKSKLEAQFQEAQKMEAIGTLAGGIAHDFNNLLAVIQGNASLMLYDIDSTHPHYELLKKITKQSISAARLTAQLLGYARKGRYEVKLINLNRVVEKTSDTFGRTNKNITIHRELVENISGIEADQSQIEQVLLNLFVNAAAAMPCGGTLTLKSMNVTNKDMKNTVYDARPDKYVLLTHLFHFYEQMLTKTIVLELLKI